MGKLFLHFGAQAPLPLDHEINCLIYWFIWSWCWANPLLAAKSCKFCCYRNLADLAFINSNLHLQCHTMHCKASGQKDYDIITYFLTTYSYSALYDIAIKYLLTIGWGDHPCKGQNKNKFRYRPKTDFYKP